MSRRIQIVGIGIKDVVVDPRRPARKGRNEILSDRTGSDGGNARCKRTFLGRTSDDEKLARDDGLGHRKRPYALRKLRVLHERGRARDRPAAPLGNKSQKQRIDVDFKRALKGKPQIIKEFFLEPAAGVVSVVADDGQAAVLQPLPGQRMRPIKSRDGCLVRHRPRRHEND